MGWLENKYALLLGPRFRNFKRRRDQWNFSCPLCGDSERNKRAARGWILDRGRGVRYYCHNCGASMRFSAFLRSQDLNLYYDYVLEQKMDRGEDHPDPVHEVKTTTGIEIGLKRVSQLKSNHPLKEYVSKRLIPSHLHYQLYFAPKFKAWSETIVPGQFESVEHDEPRLVIPLIDRDKTTFGYQGRSLNPKSRVKYITILADETRPKMYGLDRVDPWQRTYVLEGPIDAMFIPNGLAKCGGRLDYRGECTLVYDNEPRNPHTVDKIGSAIRDGYDVCLWPHSIKEKDVNDMVMAGMTPQEVKDVIDENTYRGLEAELKLAEWKRV